MFVHRDERMRRKINILLQLRFNLHKIIAKYTMGPFYFDSEEGAENLMVKNLGICFTWDIQRPYVAMYVFVSHI